MAEKRLASFAVFKPTMSYETLTGNFQMDGFHQMLRFVPSSGMDTIYLHYKDILDADTVMKMAAHEGLSPDPEEETVKGEEPYIAEFYLYVMLADPDRPNVRIPLIFRRTLADSVLGKRAIEDSYVLKRWVRGAMKEPEIETAYATEEEIRAEEEKVQSKDALIWTCPKCSYINLGMRSMCMNCGVSRAQVMKEQGGIIDKYSGRALAKFTVFEPSRSCEMLTGLFEDDTVHQMFRFTPNTGGTVQYLHYRDILDVEAIQKTVIVTSEESDSYGREDLYFSEFYIYIMLSLEERASMDIPFIFQRTLRDSVLGRRATDNANTIKRWLRDAMHEPAREAAFADEATIAEMEAGRNDPYGWSCPMCGYPNRSSRIKCLSCGHDTMNKPEKN